MSARRSLMVPLTALPPSSARRHAALRDYFCDIDATEKRMADGWELALEWPQAKERHIDPRLDEALHWWGGNIALNQMWSARRRTGRALLALYDTWTLHSWSCWLANNRHDLNGLTVLHIDDHRDLGVPRCLITDHGFEDMVTGKRIDLRDPVSIEGAIDSGALGMGSFLTFLVHSAPNVEIRHLCQYPKSVATVDYRLTRTATPDTLLRPGALRPSIDLVPIQRGLGPGTCRITPNHQHWLEGLTSGPIFLHVDMDYFNNRYDGDTDWASRIPKLDPELPAILSEVSVVTDTLKRHGALEKLSDIAVAFSPGFFPAEYWESASQALLAGLEVHNHAEATRK